MGDPEVPTGDVPVPKDVPAVELAVPKDASGIEPPMPRHAVWPAVGPSDAAPATVGLTPGEESSKAPSGIPVGATGAPGPIPSGEVMPSGGIAAPMPTWANTEPELKQAHAIVAINKRVIAVSTKMVGPFAGVGSSIQNRTLRGKENGRAATSDGSR